MATIHSVLAAGWIPFVVVTVLVLVFSVLYIHYYQHKHDKELCSTIVSILGLALALFTCALLPVDIFLVSYMKNQDGTFKDWAEDNTTRNRIENSVLYAYYSLYGLVALFLFIVIPMSYFFYEEGDENTTTKSRCCTSLKYSLVFILFLVVAFLIGICVPFKDAPHGNINDTDWDKLKNIFEDLNTSRLEDAVSFLISLLSLIGMFMLVIYTGIGMASWPLHLIKGRRNIIREFREVTEERAMTESRIEEIRNRYTGGRQLSARDRRQMHDLEDRQELMTRREHRLEDADNSCLRKCSVAFRPLQIVFGLLFVLIALLIFISLLLTNIDRAMNSLGPKMGYVLPHSTLPDLLDIVLIFAQKVFPLDYIIIFGIVLFLVFCSMGAVNAIGIWFCWIKMYKIRAHRTKPQALLLLSYILMYIVLALNILLYLAIPQYFTYGSQHYQFHSTEANATLAKSCSTSAPSKVCTMTRMATLLYRFFYKVWFFGAAYYWLSWAFLGIYVISAVVTLIRRRRSSIEGEVDAEDLQSSDEDLIPA